MAAVGALVQKREPSGEKPATAAATPSAEEVVDEVAERMAHQAATVADGAVIGLDAVAADEVVAVVEEAVAAARAQQQLQVQRAMADVNLHDPLG